MRAMVWYDSRTGSYASVLDPYTVERILLVMAAAIVAGLWTPPVRARQRCWCPRAGSRSQTRIVLSAVVLPRKRTGGRVGE
eukprot:994683-Heterocapsa_arctica.AAC.1